MANNLFGGGKTDSPPVTVPYNNVTEFQADYDGIGVLYAQSRAAHLSQAEFTGITAAYTNENIPVQTVATDVTPDHGCGGRLHHRNLG